jgi:glycosyltransferase involved in cell wall biosynthesis
MSIKFSILTPSYNQGEFLEQNIQSVLNQDVEGTQHIIMDGGSTDRTIDVLKKYDSRLFAWRSEKDKGQADALCKALDLATNEVVGWLNTDEYYEPNIFKLVANEFEKHPNAVVVYGDHRQVLATGEVIRVNRHWRFDYDVCRVQTPIITNCAAFFRRDRLIECGGFDPKYHYCMDWDLYIRLMRGNQGWCRLRRILSNFTMHPVSKTATAPEKFMAEIWDIRHREFPGMTDAQIEALRLRQVRRMKRHMLLDGVLLGKVWFKLVKERHYPQLFGFQSYRMPVISKVIDWLDPVKSPEKSIDGRHGS